MNYNMGEKPTQSIHYMETTPSTSNIPSGEMRKGVDHDTK